MKKIVGYSLLGLFFSVSLDAAGIAYVEALWKGSEAKFYQAIEKNDVRTLTRILTINRKLIDTNPSLKEHLYHGLVMAINEDNKDIVPVLLENGIDINASIDAVSNTPLIHAAQRGREDIVAFLLKQGARVNVKNLRGDTALMRAAAIGNKKIVELLLDRNADVNKQNSDGYTASMTALQEGHTDIAELLFERGARVDEKKKEVDRLLLKAITQGNKKVVSLLVQQGANVNAHDERGTTALMKAVQQGYTDIVELLLRYGADIDAMNDRQISALRLALARDKQEIAELLLKNGADFNPSNTYLATDSPLRETLKFVVGLDQSIASNLYDNVPVFNMDNPLIQLLLHRTMSLLKKYGFDTTSKRYRNTARILYTFARIIAKDFIRIYGWARLPYEKVKESEEILPRELQIELFVMHYNPALANVQIVDTKGHAERFMNIVEEDVDRLEFEEKVQAIEKLGNGTIPFDTPRAKRVAGIISNAGKDDAVLQAMITKMIELLKTYNDDSIEYRNVAKILYTVAQRIARDYKKAFGRNRVQDEVLTRDVSIPLFVASYNLQLAGLYIKNSGGQGEPFIHIVEENMQNLISKKS